MSVRFTEVKSSFLFVSIQRSYTEYWYGQSDQKVVISNNICSEEKSRQKESKMMIFNCDKPRYGPKLILIANFIVINIFILIQIISTKALHLRN